MALIKYLANLGYGTRREVAALVAAGRVSSQDGRAVLEADAWQHEHLRVDGERLDPPPGSLLMMHKPVGFVCSTNDVPPLVYDLLPPRFSHRSPVMSPVGRLDRETSGLLLLTDDGMLNHRLSSPKSHVSKTYRVTLARALGGHEATIFAGGTLLLQSESKPLAAATMRVIDDNTAELILSEGRYHQVRRMFAAVGNHVVDLQRVAIGHLMLDDMPEGAWRCVPAEDRANLTAAASRQAP